MRPVAITVALGLAGCASAGGPDVTLDGSVTSDGTTITIDSGVTVDAQRAMTLSQTASSMLEAGTSIACPSATTGTAANSYYRVFDLAAFGITTPFMVSQVSFQVEHCNQLAGNNGAVVAVRVGTYRGTPGTTLATADMTILASNPNVQVPEVIEDPGPPATTPGGTANAPISATIPAGDKLLVAVETDGTGQYEFYMGANNDGETGAGYILAPRCGVTVPTSISTVGNPPAPIHLLVTVTGTY
jgi:hypothetical protein